MPLLCMIDQKELKVEVEVTLRLTVSQSVCLGIEHPCGTCDQILFPVGMLLSEICGHFILLKICIFYDKACSYVSK
jgi:hypothetical protein